MVFGRRRTHGGKRGRRVPPEQWIWSPDQTHPAIISRAVWDAAQVMGEAHGTSRDDPALSAHPQARRTYLLRGMVRCRPCKRRMYGTVRPSTRYYANAPDVDHAYYRCPHDPANPAHQAQAPGHPATVSVRQDLLLETARQFFATHIFGPDRAARLRKRLKKIDTTEDAHVREVQALAELDPNSPAVKAMRERHLRAFADLEAERDQIGAKLAALARQADDHGGDPALLYALPLLGDALPRLPDRIKQQLFEAFDLAMLYHKTDNQVTCRATISPATLAAIITDLAAYLSGHATTGDLSRHPGGDRRP
jgi:hypothetical protein